jgi:hypothetical protein
MTRVTQVTSMCRALLAVVTTVAIGGCRATEPAPSAPPAPTAPASAAAATEAPPSGFTRTLTLQDITFRVASSNGSAENKVRIEPQGLEIDNSAMESEVDGLVTGAEVADLDADGSPEVYVFVQSAGSGAHGSLAAFAANKRKSLSGIFLPPVAEHPEAGKGYMGHDQFSLSPTRFVQRFPVYRDGDTNAAPTGGMREVQYRLVPGEAGWLLRVDSIVAR